MSAGFPDLYYGGLTNECFLYLFLLPSVCMWEIAEKKKNAEDAKD